MPSTGAKQAAKAIMRGYLSLYEPTTPRMNDIAAIIDRKTRAEDCRHYNRENGTCLIPVTNDRLVSALKAIQARMNGEWDNIHLQEYGPMSANAIADMLFIVEAVLAKYEEQ